MTRAPSMLSSSPGEQAATWGQTRRGRTSRNSGVGERLADAGVSGALMIAGLRQRSLLARGVMMASGGYFLYAAATGHFRPYAALGFVRERGLSSRGLVVERAITIAAPREPVYRYWRDFTHLPSFMRHLESVSVTDDRRSHWVARAPLGRHVEWDAEITDDRPSRLIAWRSLPGTIVPNHGEVRFADAPGNRGTEVIVHLAYQPPLGTAGAAFARLLLEEPTRQVNEDLRRLKAYLETGETPTTENQPHARLRVGLRRVDDHEPERGRERELAAAR